MIFANRYFPPQKLLLFLDDLPEHFKTCVLGKSVLKSAIYGIEIGSGKQKVLIWSQMHGNETTSSRAVCELIKYFQYSDFILKNLRLLIIPQLNPDGAASYSRLNANKLDINRDAIKLSQPESKLLNKVFDEFSPDYCFNMHDQRSVFSVGENDKSAAISFLSPAIDNNQSISKSRERSMLLIAAINKKLQREIPGNVGRYNDKYNGDCFGDSFSKKGVATLLFEAGHFKNDYSREPSKTLIFHSLIHALHLIINKNFHDKSIEEYFQIPENKERYVDVIIENTTVSDENLIFTNQQLAIQYKEVLEKQKILLRPTYHSYAKKLNLFSHSRINSFQESNLKKFVFKKNKNVDISFFLTK